MIYKQGGHVTTKLDVSSLSKISDGYTPGQLMTACGQVRFIYNLKKDVQ